MDHVLPDADDFPHRLTVLGAAATRELGSRVGGLLRGGEILLLHGPLGAGKTCFCQGVCAALDVREDVVSPTFTLVNTYGGRLRIHHLDFYRVGSEHSLTDIGVPELLDEVWDGDATALVEWPGPLLPTLTGVPRLELLVMPGADPQERTWHLRGEPAPADAWIALFDGQDAPC